MTSKINEKFFCETCDFKCFKRGDWNRHIMTAKHINDTKTIQNDTNITSDDIQVFKCRCGKKYRYHSGLWRHKNFCKGKNSHNKETDLITDETQIATPSIPPELILELIKDNKDMKQIIMEQSKTIQELAKNSGHIENHNNSHNKTFNLQFFLNENCKNAMNITEFADSIQLQVEDLEETGRLGFVEGISNIVLNNLNILDTTDRPIHCSDLRREVLYIKDNNEWIKDNENRDKMKYLIKQVTNKNIRKIPEWIKLNPNCTESDSKQNDKYLQIVSNSMSGGTIEEQQTNINKIISKVAKQVVINKK
jgi:hypothetical protein